MESLYLLFDSWYSESLMNYLSGYDCSTDEFVGANVYNVLGWITLAVAAVLAFVFYYGWDPVRNKRASWGLMLASNAIFAFAIAYWWVSSDENAGKIGTCLLQDDNGNALITSGDYVRLGISNMFIAGVFFAIVSLLCKWKSTNNRYNPF